MRSNDTPIKDLLVEINQGKAQLPDFQRSWVWDDNRIKSLIYSIMNNFPVGAAMVLTYGNENVRFRYRTIEGAPACDDVPEKLILDGQQRLTSMYSALYSRNPVHTRNEKGKELYRYYYLNVDKALDPDYDDEDCIISVPENRIVTSDFGRIVELDLSTREKEFENRMLPLNIVMEPADVAMWCTNYMNYYQLNPERVTQGMALMNTIASVIQQYKIPVITLDKDTPKEAVCRVFENVNTGGVSLTVFELVTAIFAMDDFELRKDWEERKEAFFSGDILRDVSATDFLTSLTLLSSYKKSRITNGAVSCKKKDVLNLTLVEYKKYADSLTEGFMEAEKLLQEERIFVDDDVPYSTQLIPLAAICAVLIQKNKMYITSTKEKIKQWYWCGVFGELYGGANETRFAYDIVNVIDWINGDSDALPRTVQEAYFNPTRLLSLQSRLSAAYKGIMALIMKNHSQDFISGREMDFASYKSENIDIHHVFPKAHCLKMNYPRQKWNSIVNKTPISYKTNREIGGVAPSIYLGVIEKKGQVESDTLDRYLESHFLNAQMMRSDAFYDFIIDRAKALLDEIEKAMGKPIAGRDSEEVINAFGAKLI